MKEEGGERGEGGAESGARGERREGRDERAAKRVGVRVRLYKRFLFGTPDRSDALQPL